MRYLSITVLLCCALAGCTSTSTPATPSATTTQVRRSAIEDAYASGEITYDEYEEMKWELDNPDPTDTDSIGERIWGGLD